MTGITPQLHSVVVVRCFDTFREGLMHSADSGIYLVGAIVTFACPPGQVLIGRNTSTCKGNGEWEPDPREVECKGESEYHYVEIFRSRRGPRRYLFAYHSFIKYEP